MESSKYSTFDTAQLIESIEIKNGDEIIYFKKNCIKCNSVHYLPSHSCYMASICRDMWEKPKPNQNILEKPI